MRTKPSSRYKAVEAGYHDLHQMRTDRDRDSLRTRPDFQLLLQNLAMPSTPFAPSALPRTSLVRDLDHPAWQIPNSAFF